jgi:hypothetical protein
MMLRKQPTTSKTQQPPKAEKGQTKAMEHLEGKLKGMSIKDKNTAGPSQLNATKPNHPISHGLPSKSTGFPASTKPSSQTSTVKLPSSQKGVGPKDQSEPNIVNETLAVNRVDHTLETEKKLTNELPLPEHASK